MIWPLPSAAVPLPGRRLAASWPGIPKANQWGSRTGTCARVREEPVGDWECTWLRLPRPHLSSQGELARLQEVPPGSLCSSPYSKNCINAPHPPPPHTPFIHQLQLSVPSFPDIQKQHFFIVSWEVIKHSPLILPSLCINHSFDTFPLCIALIHEVRMTASSSVVAPLSARQSFLLKLDMLEASGVE